MNKYIILTESEDDRELAIRTCDSKGKIYIRFTEEEKSLSGDWFQSSQFSVSAEALVKVTDLLQTVRDPIWGDAVDELLGCIVEPDGTNDVVVVTNQGVIRAALQHIYELRAIAGLDD